MMDDKGNLQETRVEIPLNGGGGELGMHAARNLVAHIDGLKAMETEEELQICSYAICGYALCCKECGFLTEKSVDELMELMEQLAENERKRIAARGERKIEE